MGKAVTDALLVLMVMVSLSYPPCRFMLSVAPARLRKARTHFRGSLPFSDASLVTDVGNARIFPRQGRTLFMLFSAFFRHERLTPGRCAQEGDF